MSTQPGREARGSTLTFVLLVFALSLPFWALGVVTGAQLLAGLPVSALMALCPLVAAAILTYRDEGAGATLGMLVAFFVAAIGEEVGWSGYATDRLLTRRSALRTAILLGVVWAIWHAVPYLQAHRTPTWIAWQMLDTVATRVLLVWLYVNTGRSVFAACVIHAVGNVCDFSFPSVGLEYDPRVTGLLTTIVAAIVTVVWGPRTLAGRGEAHPTPESVR